MAVDARATVRARARVEGTVQGVGFRPYVWRLANRLGLGGFVRNDEHGVLLEVEGAPAAVERFRARLTAEAPPLAVVERVAWATVAVQGQRAFAITDSTREGAADTPVTPDSATCDDCLRELFDPADRRFRYPFVNCTNCGPRFTIVRDVPYDRPLTTMAAFTMCPACQAEYDDPADRRFHAQPNACPACGPRAWLAGADGRELGLGDARDAVDAAARAARDGRIVAVKGIGGFHLACRADDEAAVSALRARKHREERPFALLAASLEAARELVELGTAEGDELVSPRRPIVVAPRRAEARVAPSVAPGHPTLGVMLAYSPLHHLLAAGAGTPLILTSGNVSDEPIAYRDEDALTRLAGIAHLFLLHDRPIHTRVDDSVVRPPLVVRRSRGHVPEPLALPVAAPGPILACGAELKSTFCLVRGRRAWVGHHIGDLENYETLRSFTEGIEHFERLFAVAPEVVAHDLHPEYLSTKYALERDDVDLVGVQHHHAHLAACLAEHGERGPAIGAVYDGTGYGTDGTVWGGEILAGGLEAFERAGALRPVRMPGGAQAIRQPWRMACAWLAEAGDERVPPTLADRVPASRWDAVVQLARTGVASPITTSAGRLFDAVSALCGLRAEVTYEGQAAIELEAACDAGERGAYPFPVEPGPPLVLDPREAVRAVAADAAAGVAAGVISARFHRALAAATAEAVVIGAERHGIDVAVLSGGAFQNLVLLRGVAKSLRDSGLRVLVPRRLPPNDGAISYGQAAVAAARAGG
jgi:hydrogenase maturation protein HypF